jgi:glycosyltransferase involved in cell wall biosynthesis
MSAAMKRVLFLAYFFPPIGGGGVQRSVKFVRYLPRYGYDPVVVTAPGGTRGRWTPQDETLLGEIPASTDVQRVSGPEPPTSTGWRRRAERILGVPAPFDRWWARSVVARGRELGASTDVIFGELVPYTTAQPAAKLARILRKPWVADLQDPWALDEMWIYPSGLHRRRDRARMRALLRSAAAIVMNTPEAVVRLLDAFPELRASIVVSIPNGFDQNDFQAAPPYRRSDKFRIVHTGYLHTERGRETSRLRRALGGLPVPEVDYLTRSHVHLLEAIDRLIAEEPDLTSIIELHLVGETSASDREVNAGSRIVHEHGYRPHAETVELMRSADLLFLPMHDLPQGMRAGLVPGKTYEYLASGRPILAAVPDGDARELLSEAGNSLICRPSDTAEMSRLISLAIGNWRAGVETPPPRAEVVARYERSHQTRQLAEVLDRVTPGS